MESGSEIFDRLVQPVKVASSRFTFWKYWNSSKEMISLLFSSVKMPSTLSRLRYSDGK